MIYGREKEKVPVAAIHTPIVPKVEMADDGKWQYVHSKLVEWIKEEDKRTEEQIFEDVANFAIEHNIGTVYLIDEEFVKTALLNEIERRKNNEQRDTF